MRCVCKELQTARSCLHFVKRKHLGLPLSLLGTLIYRVSGIYIFLKWGFYTKLKRFSAVLPTNLCRLREKVNRLNNKIKLKSIPNSGAYERLLILSFNVVDMSVLDCLIVLLFFLSQVLAIKMTMVSHNIWFYFLNLLFSPFPRLYVLFVFQHLYISMVILFHVNHSQLWNLANSIWYYNN